MTKRYTPVKKYKGNADAFDKLDRSIKRAIASDVNLSIEYEKEKLNIQIADTVHKLRMDAGWTQAQLAKKTGFTQPFIARLENPKADKKPTLETLAKVVSAFDRQLRIEIV